MSSFSLKGHEGRDSAMRQAIGTRSFVTHTMPEVFEDTRIIAVCGIVDEYDQSDPDHPYWPAHPEAEGWFFSDFYAFKQLLKGCGSSQIWITSEHPSYLVQKYSSYLHGNPYQNRRCVLGQCDLDNGIASDITVVSRDQIHSTFVARLKDEGDTAREKNQPLLVLIFSHGDQATKGIMLGADVPQNWLQIADFKSAVGSGVHATLLTTACFSGGWTVNTDLNDYTILAAAGPMSESISWNGSESMGRFCGSIYASTLIQAMKDEAETTDPPSENDKTYEEFTATIYDTLFNRMDRFASEHDIRFSAQDDDWARAWGARTGIPLISFRKRWESLPVYPATADPTSGLDREVSNQLNDVDDLNEKMVQTSLDRTILAQTRFGSIRKAEVYMKRIAKMYMNSYPGANNVASNNMLHSQLLGLPEWLTKADLEVPAVSHEPS